MTTSFVDVVIDAAVAKTVEEMASCDCPKQLADHFLETLFSDCDYDYPQDGQSYVGIVAAWGAAVLPEGGLSESIAFRGILATARLQEWPGL